MKDSNKDLIILSVALSSGKFESKIQFPIDTPEADVKELIQNWLKMSQSALKCGKEKEAETKE